MKRSEFLASRQKQSNQTQPSQAIKTDSELFGSQNNNLDNEDPSNSDPNAEPNATLDKPETTEQSHIVAVTFAPEGMKAETRRLKVGGSTEQEATKRAIVYYKKAGNKVYDAVYIKKLETNKDENENKFGKSF